MEIYLVGGAVRDELLGLPIKDKDYVVVGSSVEEMLKLGFTQVGADFPVFLHPKTKEEYALARKEVKTGIGYKGFDFVWEGVRLEEDLKRRDLTINAIAKNLDTGELIDPFNGQEDIKAKVLRHVSAHFVEDPLRVYRLARFYATFPDFSISKQTRLLCQKIAMSGELENLTPQRIWMEMLKALKAKSTINYFDFSNEVNALGFLGDFKKINLTRLKSMSVEPSCSTEVKFSSLFTGKQTVGEVSQICDNLQVPNSYKKMALFSAEFAQNLNKKENLNSKTLLHIILKSKAVNNDDFLMSFITILDDSSNWTKYFEKLLVRIREIDFAKTLADVPNSEKAKVREQTLLKVIENFNQLPNKESD